MGSSLHLAGGVQRALISAVVASLVLFASAGASSPIASPEAAFVIRSADGSAVHVLPPANGATIDEPTLVEPGGPVQLAPMLQAPMMAAALSVGPRVFPPSFGRGPLINRGGHEMTDVSFQGIYWNAAVANSAATSLGYSTIRRQMKAFIQAFSDDHHYDRSPTDDYTIIQQYSARDHIRAPLVYYGSFVGTREFAPTITNGMIRRYLTRLFDEGRVYAARNVVYGVFLPPGSTAVLQDGVASCREFCGYHAAFPYGGLWIKYIVLPYPDCSACSVNGLRVADLLTVVLGHEIREAVTNPGDDSDWAWVDAAGLEADDKCAWQHLYQMTNGGFWAQPEYSNGGVGGSTGVAYPGPGCVVPF